MQRYKGWFSVIGFLLIMFGIMSIVLSMVGLEFSFMIFLDVFGSLTAFIIKVFMVLSGIVIITLARTDWERERMDED